MLRYVSQRLLEGVGVVFGVLTVVFLVTRMLGDPAALLLPPGSSQADILRFREQLGLDLPLFQQYLTYLGQVLTGNFGNSYVHYRPAFQVILERMPATVGLATTALVIGVVLGGILGTLAAYFRDSPISTLIMLLALIGQATPIFWLGLILIDVFAVSLQWLPTGGTGGFSHFILPAITLSMFTGASVARLLRSSLVDVLNEDYMRTAESKGLKGRIVLFRHALRNALIPTITMVGIIAGELLGGAVITETVFAWPGVGLAIVEAIQINDYPVIQAGVVLLAVIFVIVSITVDLLYLALDPRIRLTAQ
ncbi:ABC transporter permease [Chelatococcus sp. YT9]|uniref:ABC transporter permease n=1 Tax=Chelatococcus sp. YT9 TaxID=2835635 RepID=UPI001BCFFE21|nr:ABC transporter permease [Chelatococcus sp. YT9]MBS7701257.1 ABC transporter permease [Chelatococcus sp. YT9]